MPSSSSSKLKSSFSFPNLCLSFLNFTLFILSATSFAPIILIKTPPTSLGWALLISSTISLFTSFLGVFARLTHSCFVTYLSFIMASLIGQALSLAALFVKEKSSLRMLDSRRDPREAKLLVRLECVVLMVMFLFQVFVLGVVCVVHTRWVKKEEGMVNAGKVTEGKVVELDEKMNDQV